jgi:hypothetical protein
MKDLEGRNGRIAESMRLTLAPEARNGARIKVVGVGGGGSNAVDRMVEVGIRTSAVRPRWRTPTRSFRRSPVPT